jgi:hypothetical protein
LVLLYLAILHQGDFVTNCRELNLVAHVGRLQGIKLLIGNLHFFHDGVLTVLSLVKCNAVVEQKEVHRTHPVDSLLKVVGACFADALISLARLQYNLEALIVCIVTFAEDEDILFLVNALQISTILNPIHDSLRLLARFEEPFVIVFRALVRF